MDFSEFFHISSKDATGAGELRIPLDPKEWPESWSTIETKTYTRLPKISLPETDPKADHFALIRDRRSRFAFTSEPLTLEAMSTLLRYSCGLFFQDDVATHRAQPSAGSRYPIELYPIVLRGNDALASGVYHYNVDHHRLELLWSRTFSPEEKRALVTHENIDDAACLLVMSATFDRTKRKYGERGYRYIMLEAGHIGQNVCLAATHLNLSCCPLGNTRDGAIETLLDIDGVNESVVYATLIG